VSTVDSPRTWSLPPSPGPEVTALRTPAGFVWHRRYWAGGGERWERRNDDGDLLDANSWHDLLGIVDPDTGIPIVLTDASPTPPESAPTSSAQGDEGGAGTPIPAPAAGGAS